MLPIRLRRGDSRTAANRQIILWAAARFSWICPGPPRICCYSAPGQLLGGENTSHFRSKLGSEFRESPWTGAASASQKRQIRLRGESSQGKSSPALAVCVNKRANVGAGSPSPGRSSLRTDVTSFMKNVLVRRFFGMQGKKKPGIELRAQRRNPQRRIHPAPNYPLKKIRPLPRAWLRREPDGDVSAVIWTCRPAACTSMMRAGQRY